MFLMIMFSKINLNKYSKMSLQLFCLKVAVTLPANICTKDF